MENRFSIHIGRKINLRFPEISNMARIFIYSLVLASLLYNPLLGAKLVEIYVDAGNPRSSDGNPGSIVSPMLTISGAVKKAAELIRRGEDVRIVINPGVYRESFKLFVGEKSSGALVMEASETGRVIVSGSDVWDNWKAEKKPGVFSHDWQYDWGVAPMPKGVEPVKEKITPIVRRREMIFINGERLEQTLSLDKLSEGGFFVDEGKNRVFIHLKDGTNPAESLVEVSTRETLADFLQVENVTLKGLIFQHSNGDILSSGVRFTKCSNVTVEDCEISWHNWRGLKFGHCRGVKVIRCRVNHNGAMGIGARWGKDFHFEDCETSFNNWRGFMAGFVGWMLSGTKLMNIHQARIVNHKAYGNFCRGLWLDIDNVDFEIEKGDFSENYLDGVFVEACQGPVKLSNNKIADNRRAGLRITNSDNVSIEGNLISGNGIQIEVVSSGRKEKNWETGEEFQTKLENIAIRGNDIVCGEKEQLLFGTQLNRFKWKYFLEHFRSEENTWYNPHNERAFQVWRGDEKQTVTLEEWREITGQDGNSVFGEPGGKNQ